MNIDEYRIWLLREEASLIEAINDAGDEPVEEALEQLAVVQCELMGLIEKESVK